MNIFVGNLSYQAVENDLIKLFTEYGTVLSAKIRLDNYSHRSRGFAFVEMEDKAAGELAIEKLNNTIFMQQPLKVNEAKPPSGGIKKL